MRIVETHIEVENVEKSICLYKKLLPHKKILRWADGKVGAFVFDDGSAFGCWEKGHKGILNGRGGKHVHFAFQIQPDEYEKYKEIIISAGLKPLEYDWGNSHKSLYFFDYDGHQGEFITTDWIGLNNI